MVVHVLFEGVCLRRTRTDNDEEDQISACPIREIVLSYGTKSVRVLCHDHGTQKIQEFQQATKEEKKRKDIWPVSAESEN